MKSQCLQPLPRIQIKTRPRGRALKLHRSDRMPTKLGCVSRSAKLIAEGGPLCANTGRPHNDAIDPKRTCPCSLGRIAVNVSAALKIHDDGSLDTHASLVRGGPFPNGCVANCKTATIRSGSMDCLVLRRPPRGFGSSDRHTCCSDDSLPI